MRQASEKYGTAEMKEEECLLFLEVAIIDNGCDIKESIADMKMIDTLLYATKLQTVAGAMTKRTKAGYLRKGADLYNTFDRIIEGRINKAFE